MQKISVVIIRQGLLLLFSDRIARLREAGTASCRNGLVGVSIGYGQWGLSRYIRAKLYRLYGK
jgi:hypothetical protein